MHRAAWWFVLPVIFLLAACGAPTLPPPGVSEQAGALVLPARATPPASVLLLPTPAITAPEAAAGSAEPAALVAAGESLYATNCAPCHRLNGEGNLERFPALNRNVLVTGASPQPLIRIVLHGRGVMPAFDRALTAGEVAAILSYVRQAWSNEAAVVTPDQVRQVASTPADEQANAGRAAP